MKYEQPSLFNTESNTMYDGYEVRNTANIISNGGKIKLTKGQIFYLIVKHFDGQYSLAIPNQYGGSSGFLVTDNQFKKHFKYLGRKIYPKSAGIWDGNKWINNPDFN